MFDVAGAEWGDTRECRTTTPVHVRAPHTTSTRVSSPSRAPTPVDRHHLGSRVIDLEMCGVFFHGRRSYHTDKQASEELGFDEVVVGGKMTMAMVGQMLEQAFGRDYYEGGTLDVKFTNIVWPNDRVTAKGVITREEAGKAHVTVWMEKDDSTVVIVGGATVSV